MSNPAMINWDAAMGGWIWAAWVWQSTIVLGLAVVFSLLWRRHPGRAHLILVMGLLVAIALPAAGIVAQRAGLGILPPRTNSAAMLDPAMIPPPTENKGESSNTAVLSNHGTEVHYPYSDSDRNRSLPSWIAPFYLTVGGLFLLRFLISLAGGVRLLAKARPLVNERLQALLETAMSRIGVQRAPVIYSTDDVKCPAVWCWAIHPALLLPSRMTRRSDETSNASLPDIEASNTGALHAATSRTTTSEITTPGVDDWISIFCHELAHVRRRDHLAAVAAELAGCLLWWNPLAWWCRSRLHRLSDEACDQWVVNSGRAPEDYAEMLIHLIPHPRSLTALSMANGGGGMKRRLSALLESSPRSPSVGKRWAAAGIAAAVVLISLAVCLQPSTRSASIVEASKSASNFQSAVTSSITPSPAASPVGEKSPSASSSDGNLLFNPGMESGDTEPTGWIQGTPIEGVEFIWDRKVAHSGSASLCLRKTANRFFPITQWSQGVSISPAPMERKLKLSSWIKAERALKAILDVQYTNSSGNWEHQWAVYIGQRQTGSPPVNQDELERCSGTHDWKPYSGVVKLPPGAHDVNVGLQIYGPGAVWFDDLRLEWIPLDHQAPQAAK